MSNSSPNVLFILSDQHNARFLGHKGHPHAKTPNIDRLAGEGVRFDNAIAQNTICTPSRVCFHSGQYTHNHGYYGLNGPNPNGLPTGFGHFRRSGYTTGAIGKIHCPEYWIEDDCDTFLEVCRSSSIGGAPQYFAYLESKGIFEDLDYNLFKSLDGCPSRMRYEDSPEGWSVRESIDFMKKAIGKEKPFFLECSFFRPHAPYTPSEQFWSSYSESDLTLPPNADYGMENKAPHMIEMAEKYKRGEWAAFEPKTFEAARIRKLHGYLGCVSQVDFAVGELLNWLGEAGIEEDTIVIYGSDHGEYACQHGMMEKAPGICSDAVTRVPFIWRWPGKFKANHMASEIVETVDMSATLCTLADIEPMETSDGKDISELLEGKAKKIHSIGVTESAWSKSVRMDQYRYVYYPIEMFSEHYPHGFGELYDLEADPWEMHNLYFDMEYANIVEELKSYLIDWLVTTTRPTTVAHGRSNNVPGPQASRRYDHWINGDGKINPNELRSRFINYL